VSFNDIMDDADLVADKFEKEPVASRFSDPRVRKWKQPIFSPESSKTEYSLEDESFASVSSLNFEDICDNETRVLLILHEVVLIDLSLDKDEDVDVKSLGHDNLLELLDYYVSLEVF